MSEYAAVLKTVKDNPAQTLSQLASLMGVPNDTTALAKALSMLVQDGRITATGSGPGTTYSSTSTQ